MADIAEFLDATLNGEFSADQKAVIYRLFQEFQTDHHIPNPNDYREAAKRCLKILLVIDDLMSQTRCPKRTWREISIGLGLPSACFSHLSEVQIARTSRQSRAAVSWRVRKFLRLARLGPAFNANGSALAGFSSIPS